MKKKLRSVATSSLGNIIEWYDFGLFTIFSTLFSKLFFSVDHSQTALLNTISIFTVGYLCRPLGALIFGYLGDKFGRAKTLRLSILMITLPTLCIGILPTYQQIGVFAPILLLFIRILQGISIGGEYSGTIVYLAESAPGKHRALFTAFASIGANIGILFAAIVGIIINHLFSLSQLENGIWRLPYLLSGLISLFIYFYRLKLDETNVFEYLKQHALVPNNPIRVLFKQEKFALFKTLGLVCMGSTFYYFTFIYLPMIMTSELHLTFNFVSELMTLLLITMIVMTPIAALCCDRLGRKRLLYFNSISIFCLIVPAFYLFFKVHTLGLILILLFFTMLSASEQSTTPITIIENCPLPARYSCVALGYNLGNGFLGGTVPLICTWLVKFTHVQYLSAVYIAMCAFITFLVIFKFIPETKDQVLNLASK